MRSAVANKGNLAFILTCNPNQVITELNNLDWRFSAFENSKASSYVDAMRTATNYMKDKEGTRYIVFLSYLPGSSHFSGAVGVLKRNSSDYTTFYTTSCCRDNRGNEGDGSPYDYTIWKDTGKYGGNIYNKNIGDTLKQIVSNAGTSTVIKTVASKTVESDENLKVKLNNYVPNQEIKPSLAIDGALYNVGDSISSDIIYFDREQSSYVLDLKMVKNFLNLSDEKLKNAEIQIEYLIAN